MHHEWPGIPHKLLENWGLRGICETFDLPPVRAPVGVWSACFVRKTRFFLAPIAFSERVSCAHNPEVAGSSPASATRPKTRYLRIASLFLPFFPFGFRRIKTKIDWFSPFFLGGKSGGRDKNRGAAVVGGRSARRRDGD